MKWRTSTGSALVILMILAGCGSRSALHLGPSRDAGPDGDIDEPLAVECGREDRYTTIDRPIAIEVEVDHHHPLTLERWQLVGAPMGSTAAAEPAIGHVTSITPDTTGDYQLRFDVEDDRGHQASCTFAVHSIVGPPVALCPEEELTTPGGVGLPLTGDGFDDRGIVSYSWRVVSGPGMANVLPPVGEVVEFFAAEPGSYIVELTVEDTDGASHSCMFTIRVITAPLLACPSGVVQAPTRQPTRITAVVTDDTAIRDVEWTVLTQPPGSGPQIQTTGDRFVIDFIPDRIGTYILQVEAIDDDGLRATCTVEVLATPTGPDAVCPGTIRTTPLSTVMITGNGVDDGSIVDYRWMLIGQPMGSAADPPTPAESPVTSFRPDVAGNYDLSLTVTDDDGNQSSCQVTVQAVPEEGLRIEIFWNGPPDRSCDEFPGGGCDPTDVDLHLLRPGGESWFDGAGDCHWANCLGGLEWGVGGADDNPRLDIDDTEGFGPENINLDVPVPGTYRIGVHLWDADAFTSAEVTVNIYCGAGSTEPEATFGPVTLNDNTEFFDDDNDFWRVADVDITGFGCNVIDLAGAGGPNIITSATARTTR